MKKKNVVRLGIIGTCLLCIISCLPFTTKIEQQEGVSRCSPPVENFSEKDLVGVWVAQNPNHKDTLTIKANGTYKQVIHIELADESLPIDYVSDWQAWHLEYSEDNIPYLHLVGMRFCGMNTDISCEIRDGGGYDFCQDKYLRMNGKGILIVLETSDGRYNYLHYPLGSEGSWIYSLQKP